MIAPIDTVTIEDFRGIRRLELRLDPRVTVLFGANAAGKTTILDAIAIGLGAYVARVPGAKGRGFAKTGDIRVPWATTPAGNERRGVMQRRVSVGLETSAGLAWSVSAWRGEVDRDRAVPKLGTRKLREAVDPLIREALDVAPGERTPPLPFVAAYGNERAVVEVPLRERDFQKEFTRLAALDDALRATTRFKAVFEWFRVMEDEERREIQRRRDFAFKLPELEWVRRAVERAELRCHNPRVKTKPLRMLVDFEHDGGGVQELDLSALSDGYRTHFALVVDVARRMVQLNPSPDLIDPERGTNGVGVVLIDEVDLHLDPQWQARVVRGLLAAFPNVQFVLTTHSEQVIGSVEAASVRKLVWGDGAIAVEGVPFAQGATGERILADLMG